MRFDTIRVESGRNQSDREKLLKKKKTKEKQKL